MIMCQNYKDPDVPDCLGEADGRYTMDFTDVVPDGKIFWCSVCGPRAQELDAKLQKAFETQPDFAGKLEAEINKVRQ
jgi:hypothetical protein